VLVRVCDLCWHEDRVAPQPQRVSEVEIVAPQRRAQANGEGEIIGSPLMSVPTDWVLDSDVGMVYLLISNLDLNAGKLNAYGQQYSLQYTYLL
jgi:hypothetical protein